MKMKKSLVVGALAALTLCGSAPSFAQPDLNDQAKGANPAQQMPFGNWEQWQKMTPEERKAATRQYTEQMLRGFLGAMGHEDKAMQDAVVATALERETMLEDVREKHRAVTRGLMNRETPDEEIQDLMIDLQTSIETAKTKHAASVAALDKQIQFSQNPRLAAFLSLIGVTSDDSALLGGVLGNFMGAMANMAAAQPPAG